MHASGATKLGSDQRWAVDTPAIRQQNEAARLPGAAGGGQRVGRRRSSSGLSADPAPNAQAAAHIYDPQTMLKFVNLCRQNAQALRAGLASKSQYVQQLSTHDTDMNDFKDLVAGLEERTFNAIPIISPTAEAWYGGSPATKRKLFIKVTQGNFHAEKDTSLSYDNLC